MKKVFLLLLLCGVFENSPAQSTIDSLRREALQKYLNFPKNDDSVVRLIEPGWDSMFSFSESALQYIQQSILLSKKQESDVGLSQAYGQYAWLEELNGNYAEALRYRFQSLKAAERAGKFIWLSFAYNGLGGTYQETDDYENASYYLLKAKALCAKNWNPVFKPGPFNDTVFAYFFTYLNIAKMHERFNHIDSALYYAMHVYDGWVKVNGTANWGGLNIVMGNIAAKLDQFEKAFNSYHIGVLLSAERDEKVELMLGYTGLSKLFAKVGETDSSIYYANKVLELSSVGRNMVVKLEALNLLANAFKLKGISDSVVKYLDLTVAAKDSLFGRQKMMQFQSVAFNEQLTQLEIKDEQERYVNRVRNYLFIAGLAVLLLVTGILYRGNRQKQQAKKRIEIAYNQLKSTQAQLVQSEKMASLGELTAGIAHEIQNPLNFVNNFSEVNMGLVDELQAELKAGNTEEAIAISKDLKGNQEKINHHGKRADSIVKDMLQHSRTSSSGREATDINKLAETYLRLSYNGLRAKDKTMQAKLQTDFDQSLGAITIIPQEIGRVILNLCNNAFYAVAEKSTQQPENYEPTVFLSTRKKESEVEIRIKDNGNGIPQKLKDKIFQPFFTTRPPGQGTGMGLSLSHDIIKAHGGTLQVETVEDEGSEFIILLPGLSATNKTSPTA